MDRVGISEIPLFRGPESDPIPLKEQKKIQIDIRRPIRSGKASNGPIRRSIKDPQKLTLPRGEKEGQKALFDRDEIKNWRKKPAASSKTSTQSQEKVQRTNNDDLRDRLVCDTQSSSGNRKPSILSRLGTRAPPPLEKPDVKPWEVNPEFVPRGRNYYEHDTREEALKMSLKMNGGYALPRTRGGKGFNNSRPRPYESRGSGGSFRKHRRDHSDSITWKHDRYMGEREFHR